MSGLIYIFGVLFIMVRLLYILTKHVIDIVYRLWVSAKCVVLLGILVVWFYFNGPWPIIQYYQAFYLYNLSRFTSLSSKSSGRNCSVIFRHKSIRDRSFNLKGGVMVFCFAQNFFSDNTRVRIFIFFVAQSAKFFSRI